MNKDDLDSKSVHALKFDRTDFSTIFSDDVELTDVRYNDPFVYKYFYFTDATTQREFFAKPTIKFAHKDDLNDPFELSRRWQAFGCPFTKAVFDKYVRKRFEAQLTDIGLITKKLREQAKIRGLSLSRQQARQWLRSTEGKAEIAKVREAGLERMSAIEILFPQIFRENESDFIDSFARETGILSLTEDPHSPRMWREYAGNGCGFVLEFDAKHEFFLHLAEDGQTRKLLRKVFYRDNRIEDFWKNPNYLFLVKESKYAFEKEWRMLKSLNQSNRHILANGKPIYLVEMPLGLIKSITFGPEFPPSLISSCVALLHGFDEGIKIRHTARDRK